MYLRNNSKHLSYINPWFTAVTSISKPQNSISNKQNVTCICNHSYEKQDDQKYGTMEESSFSCMGHVIPEEHLQQWLRNYITHEVTDITVAKLFPTINGHTLIEKR